MTGRAKQQLPLGHRPPEDRVEQDCHGCGAVDTHPRHIIAEADGTTTIKHMDCCNCAVCVTQLDHAGGKRGLELAQHLQDHAEEIRGQVDAVIAAHEAAEGRG